MIEKRDLFCSETNQTVTAMVELVKVGRGKNATTEDNPVGCMNALSCDNATFCRFVNPLTTRNPLVASTSDATPAPTA